MMCRGGAELSVGAACRHLAQNVFIDVAHRVTVVHIERIHAVDYLGKVGIRKIADFM